MIQRIQSLWLFLASLLIFLTLRLSFYSGILAAGREFHSMVPNDNLFILILTSGLGTLLLINIFLFTNRTLQFRLCVVAILVEVVVLIFTFKELDKYSKGSFDIWSLLHVLVIFCIVKATIAIYRDDKLVKSSNRLR